MAHMADYPQHPIELASLQFLPYIIQWSIDEIILQRNKVKLFSCVFISYYGVSPRHSVEENLKVYKAEMTAAHYLHLWFNVSHISLSNCLLSW